MIMKFAFTIAPPHNYIRNFLLSHYYLNIYCFITKAFTESKMHTIIAHLCCSNHSGEVAQMRCGGHLTRYSWCYKHVVRKRSSDYYNIIILLVLALLTTEHADIYAGDWKKKIISIRDIIRLQLACEVMHLEARDSIFNTAVNAFGEECVHTNM